MASARSATGGGVSRNAMQSHHSTEGITMNRQHTAMTWGLAALLLCLTAGVAQARSFDVKDTVRRTFNVRSGGTLFVDMDQGNVEVQSVRGGELTIEVIRIAKVENRDDAQRYFDQHDLAFNQRGNDIVLESRIDKNRDKGFWGRWRGKDRMKINVIVRVPVRYNFDFSSGAGNVQVQDLEGNVEGKTGAGNIALRDIGGSVRITSGSGNIEVDRVDGRVEAKTGAGNVELAGVMGAVQAQSGAGNIAAEIARQPKEDSSLESGAGNVTVYLDPRIGVNVDAVAQVGSAECDFALKVEGKWMRQYFEGRINGGGPELTMRSGVGNVALKKR